MKLDSLAAEVGFDMTMDAILARVEQLVKLEGDAVVESKTVAYSLRRKVCKKDKHMAEFLQWLARGSRLYMCKEFQRCP